MFLFFVVRTKSKSHVRKKYNSCNFTMSISFTFCTCFQLDEEHFFCQNISRECSTINGSSSSETTQFHHLLRFDFGQLSISRQKIFPYSVNSRRNYHSIVSLSAGQVVKLEQANRYGQFFFQFLLSYAPSLARTYGKPPRTIVYLSKFIIIQIEPLPLCIVNVIICHCGA